MRYEITLRRPAGPSNPRADRKWLETTTEQPDLASAVAFLYHQLKKTSADNVQQISVVLIRTPRAPASIPEATPSQPTTRQKTRGK